ncbi:MAG TPA: PPC domain-containing protein, partial [Phycisphaerae bacterium]|nr:PPC domain-containing protein [Phycisphaerae bacterium]
MRTPKTILAIAAAGLMLPLTAGSAKAGVSISLGLNLGRRLQPVVVQAPVAMEATTEMPIMLLPNQHTAVDLAGHAGSYQYFKMVVPAGQTYLNVLTEGGAGDSDLYLARGVLPTPTSYHYASMDSGTEEQLSILHPQAGAWYVLVYGAGGYRDVSLLGSWWQQQVYDDAATTLFQPVYVPNTQVDVYWGSIGSRRPAGGLIHFILDSLRHRRPARHRRYDVPRRPYI